LEYIFTASQKKVTDGNIQFWMSTHLWSAAEERKKKSWRRLHFTVSQLHHLWTRMCCCHRTILTHENSQALTAHSSTRWEIPTINDIALPDKSSESYKASLAI